MNNAIVISLGGMTLTVPGEYQGALEIDGKRIVFSGLVPAPVSLDVEFRWRFGAEKISAIKAVRAMSNKGLGEAKAMIQTGEVRTLKDDNCWETHELPTGAFGKITATSPEEAIQLREILRTYGYLVKP